MEQSNIINFLLASMILLLIFKMILCKHENETFISNCIKYPYLCNNKLPTQNESLYKDKRVDYLMNDLDKISPRYNPSSRNTNNTENTENTRRNRFSIFNRRTPISFTRRRFFNPQANIL
jgi:hypothetical protein